MVWFQCEDCGDTLKKPKVRGHASQCSASRFSCVDCLQVFDAYTVQQHTSCVTEHEKYALSITKPGQEHLMSAAANKEQGGGGSSGGGSRPGSSSSSKGGAGGRTGQHAGGGGGHGKPPVDSKGGGRK